MGMGLSVTRKFLQASSLAALVCCPGIGTAVALSLREAVATALDSAPEIGQAVENREAIQFELRQARGLYLPRIDAEASAGGRRLDNPSRRSIGEEKRGLGPLEAGLVATLKLFDGYGREAEVERQASRVDGASLRVLERSEFIALQVVREYIEATLQARVVEQNRQNVAYHQSIVGRIRANVESGALTDADLKQGEERVLASRARLIEAEQELAAARIRFLRYVGKPIGRAEALPALVRGNLPRTMDQALGLAVRNNPRLKVAGADIDATNALVKKAKSAHYPEMFLEGRVRGGQDLDGARGRTTDLQGRVVMRWNLYNGGITDANVQEQTRRVAEAKHSRDQVLREIREALRLSFDRRVRQAQLASILTQQLNAGDRVVSAYAEQFSVGRRSLLDLLDAQNTRHNARILRTTAEASALFAEYRIVASIGSLVSALGLKPPAQAQVYARTEADVPPTNSTDKLPRTAPPRGKPWMPAGAIQ